MNARILALIVAGVAALATGCGHEAPRKTSGGAGNPKGGTGMVKDFEVKRTDEEWRKLLTPDEYRVTRKHGTEPAFTGRYLNTKTPGTYVCAGCGQDLFQSETKFDSGTGWPSFWQPIAAKVGTKSDRTLFMTRTEVHCSRCGSHLGHVFDDGPKPTGQRYCINSASLKLVEKEKGK